MYYLSELAVNNVRYYQFAITSLWVKPLLNYPETILVLYHVYPISTITELQLYLKGRLEVYLWLNCSSHGVDMI